jgi:hypothetical protein
VQASCHEKGPIARSHIRTQLAVDDRRRPRSPNTSEVPGTGRHACLVHKSLQVPRGGGGLVQIDTGATGATRTDQARKLSRFGPSTFSPSVHRRSRSQTSHRSTIVRPPIRLLLWPRPSSIIDAPLHVLPRHPLHARVLAAVAVAGQPVQSLPVHHPFRPPLRGPRQQQSNASPHIRLTSPPSPSSLHGYTNTREELDNTISLLSPSRE